VIYSKDDNPKLNILIKGSVGLAIKKNKLINTEIIQKIEVK
jgi:hypothetical protein